MKLEKTLDRLPWWNKKFAAWLQPAEPVFNLLLILIAALCIYAIYKLQPHYKALLIACLLSP
jgi:hypothetical protein